MIGGRSIGRVMTRRRGPSIEDTFPSGHMRPMCAWKEGVSLNGFFFGSLYVDRVLVV